MVLVTEAFALHFDVPLKCISRKKAQPFEQNLEFLLIKKNKTLRVILLY